MMLAVVATLLALPPMAAAQTSPSPARPLIAQPIADNILTVLAGNTRPEAKNPANDRGLVPDGMAMPHMLLQLRRPPEQEQALAALIDQLHDPNSPNFHRWLTAAEFGAAFGPAASDVAAVTGWLQQHGFAIDAVYPSRMVIGFSGSAGQVRAAFHSEIHYLSVGGVTRFANMTDPQIPAAMAPAVVGVVSLHNIPPKPMHRMRVQNRARAKGELTVGGCQYAGYVEGSDCYVMAPADLATIYNFGPVFKSGNTGQNQTIYLIEDSDLYGGTSGGTNSDWSTFRSTFGLSGYSATINTVHPGNNCTDPQTNGDDGEAILDAEWASAAAPSANIVMAACATGATFGGLIALQGLINGASPPAIISLSYGQCEVTNGATANAAFSSIFQQGVAEGASIFVSSGDSAADVCDRGDQLAYSGIGVNGFGSTPYNVSVGGTDFSAVSSQTVATYWSATNTSNFGSALSYIPEMPWNASCGSLLIAAFYGYSSGNAAYNFCNSILDDQGAWAIYSYANGGGSGGPSGCATGASTFPQSLPVVDGTCAGWPKPSWQSGFIGIQNDGVRDLPDVSLFASNSVWDSYYVFCWSDTSEGALGCTGAPSSWDGAGGTSFATPIWAGIQALINNATGSKQGLPNYRYYQLAAQEYGSNGSTACNSSNGNGVGSTCVFYDVTADGIVVPCANYYDLGYAGYFDCYDPGGVNSTGVLSTNDNTYAPAYAAMTGWDFATGIGTVNVANLIASWNGKPLADSHDYNGDGKSDILWRNTSGAIALWLMNGGQILQGGGLGSVSTTWSIVGQRDFNGDGDADILWRDSSGDLALWLMNGLTVSSGAGLGNVSTTWTIDGTGDLNGDGKGDILWRDTAGDIAIWYMNGATIASSTGLGNVSTTWTIAGDDNRGNILWHDASGNYVVWHISGGQVTATASLGNVPLATWQVAGIGDFNGDGITDILWRDTAGDVVIWFLNTSFGVQSTASLGNVSTTWTIAQTGDYNGDGKSDILWLDTAGDIAVWFMNGGAIGSTAGLGNVGTTWTAQSLNAE